MPTGGPVVGTVPIIKVKLEKEIKFLSFFDKGIVYFSSEIYFL